jgi:regulator of protease activity HflC (stomatin/prohibitin superfamily)
MGKRTSAIARQWERAVVLRLGRYVGLRGPGLFWIIPFVDNVSAWVDRRTVQSVGRDGAIR